VYGVGIIMNQVKVMGSTGVLKNVIGNIQPIIMVVVEEEVVSLLPLFAKP
jgi:hypothetical protein